MKLTVAMLLVVAVAAENVYKRQKEESFWLEEFGEAITSTLQLEQLEQTNTRFRADEFSKAAKESGFPEVASGKGTIRGRSDQHAHSFFEIPYAEAPIGEKRFMPPTAKAFQENIDATQQNFVRCFEKPSKHGPYNKNYSEDCLVLTVHIPSTVDEKEVNSGQYTRLRPVMFWLHGGAFIYGAGTMMNYDGRYLSHSSDTVVVTINYRLGSLGFLVFEEEGTRFDGNQGFKDQQLALKWVHEEIENFGGDPDQITIFGVSAGAQSVMLHLASHVSAPYFRRAIMESNAAVFSYPDPDRAMQYTSVLTEELGCADKYNSKLQCLREEPAFNLLDAMKAVMKMSLVNGDSLTSIEPFRPTAEGGDEFPVQPLEMFRDGKWNTDKEVLMGTNREEMAKISTRYYNQTLSKMFFEKAQRFLVGEELAPNTTEKYGQLAPPNQPSFDYTEIIAQEASDFYFVCPSRLLARFIVKTSDSSNNYLYSWEHASCEDPTRNCNYSCHGCEVTYVFQTRDLLGLPNEEDERLMSSMFSDFWGSFVYTGVPQSSNHDEWLKYKSMREDMHMIYPRGEMESDYKEDICDFWDSLNFYVEIKDDEDSDGNGGAGKVTTTFITMIALASGCFFLQF